VFLNGVQMFAFVPDMLQLGEIMIADNGKSSGAR
jgi:hypothetical protein